jgi:uncharacterized membrane protein (DUF4010 family)
MILPGTDWPYPLVLSRIALALAIGLFVGLERERRRKASGVRTFAFVTLLGCLGGLLGEPYALLGIFLLGILIVFLNLQTLLIDHSTELTTSAALLIMGVTGVLCGQGHTFTPVAVAVATAALLAWKEPLKGFSRHLSDAELRSAVLLAILAFIIYPALPAQTIDPWHVISPREALITVILIAGIGFVNYVLWKIYGTRGIELTGFLAGLVNSTVAVGELAARLRETDDGRFAAIVYRGSLLATAAMVVRNAVILGLLAPQALFASILASIFMLAACGILIVFDWHAVPQNDFKTAPIHLQSPFSLTSALKYSLIFLALQIATVLAQQLLGQLGVYVTSLLGGLVSSASVVASSAALSTQGVISTTTAGISAVIASLTSALINLPLIMRGGNRDLTRRFALATGLVLLFGILGTLLQVFVLQ